MPPDTDQADLVPPDVHSSCNTNAQNLQSQAFTFFEKL